MRCDAMRCDAMRCNATHHNLNNATHFIHACGIQCFMDCHMFTLAAVVETVLLWVLLLLGRCCRQHPLCAVPLVALSRGATTAHHRCLSIYRSFAFYLHVCTTFLSAT